MMIVCDRCGTIESKKNTIEVYYLALNTIVFQKKYMKLKQAQKNTIDHYHLCKKCVKLTRSLLKNTMKAKAVFLEE